MKKIINNVKNNLNAKLIKFAVTGSSGLLIDIYITWFLKEKLFFDQYIAHVVCYGDVDHLIPGQTDQAIS